MSRKNKKKGVNIKWYKEPEEHDYPAALSYLSLLFDEKIAARIVKLLEEAKMSEFKSKDIFRASKESLLGISNSHVQSNIDKIEKGRKMSPLLLVRVGNLLIIADGYHRVCAVYHFDEDAIIPCKIVTYE